MWQALCTPCWPQAGSWYTSTAWPEVMQISSYIMHIQFSGLIVESPALSVIVSMDICVGSSYIYLYFKPQFISVFWWWICVLHEGCSGFLFISFPPCCLSFKNLLLLLCRYECLPFLLDNIITMSPPCSGWLVLIKVGGGGMYSLLTEGGRGKISLLKPEQSNVFLQARGPHLWFVTYCTPWLGQYKFWHQSPTGLVVSQNVIRHFRATPEGLG